MCRCKGDMEKAPTKKIESWIAEKETRKAIMRQGFEKLGKNRWFVTLPRRMRRTKDATIFDNS